MSNYGYYPPPYPYQPVYPQPPYIQRIEDRLKEIEQRYANLQQQVTPISYGPYGQPTADNGPGYTVPQQPTEQSNQFIIVKSEDDAWNYLPDWKGNKQYFYDEKNNAFYVKRFDANIPATFKEIYRKVEIEQSNKQEQSNEQNILTPRIDRMQEQLNDLENLLCEVKEMISDAANTSAIDGERLEVDNRQNARSRANNESSNEDRPVRKVSRGSNGRFRTNSEK